MIEEQKDTSCLTCLANNNGINLMKAVELDGLSKQEFGYQILNSDSDVVFTICGNPIGEEETQHLKYIWSEEKINERNKYIIKLYNEMTPPFDIMKRVMRVAPKKDWLIITSEIEILDIVNEHYKKKGLHTMENEKESFCTYLNFLDKAFYQVYKFVMYNSKGLSFQKIVKACSIGQKLLDTRGEICGRFKPTLKTETLHERYKAVIDYFKDSNNLDDSGQENDMKRFANELRKKAREVAEN